MSIKDNDGGSSTTVTILSNQQTNLSVLEMEDAQRTKYRSIEKTSAYISVIDVMSGRQVPDRLNSRVRPFDPTSPGWLGIQS